jgi:hypothetical protein
VAIAKSGLSLKFWKRLATLLDYCFGGSAAHRQRRLDLASPPPLNKRFMDIGRAAHGMAANTNIACLIPTVTASDSQGKWTIRRRNRFNL